MRTPPNKKEEIIKTEKVTRVEVIDHSKGGKGRDYVKWQEGIKVELSLQDDGRTLKVFIGNERRK